MSEEWQAEQIPYPLDVEYYGAKAGLFDFTDAEEDGLSGSHAGNTFILEQELLDE